MEERNYKRGKDHGNYKHITEKQLDLVRRCLKRGLHLNDVADTLKIARSTLYKRMTEDKDLSDTVYNGVVENYLDSEEKLENGKMNQNIFIYFSKTKWQRLFPKERKTEDQINQNNKPAVQVFYPKHMNCSCQKTNNSGNECCKSENTY